jgi:quercetin dioxygenase-like cupin family protein
MTVWEEVMAKLFLIFSALFALVVPNLVNAQQQLPAATQQTATIKRTVLQKWEIPGSSYEVVYALVEIPANTTVGRHTHPGSVFAYMMEGDYTFMPDGQPEKTYKTGDNFRIEPGVIHNEKSGTTPSKLMVVFTVEKGKPLASPAP